jgi:hypothetical protein
MNEGQTMSCDDGAGRRATADDDSSDERPWPERSRGPKPHAEPEDPAPEEAGYGYGV